MCMTEPAIDQMFVACNVDTHIYTHKHTYVEPISPVSYQYGAVRGESRCENYPFLLSDFVLDVSEI